MAVKRRVNWVSQQRVDTPDMRSIESAASNDFDELMQTLYLGSGEGYIFRGFDILMAGLIGGAASGAQMNVAEAAILHSKSSQSGTFLVVRPGTAPQVLNSATNTIVQGAFSPSSLNYVGIEYIRFIDDTTASQVYIWDPTINDETTKVIPRAQILKFNIIITTGTWAANVLPVCTITTDAGNNVLSIEDNRRLMNRLGTAGRTTPNPFYSYPWTAHAEGRIESPFISSSNATNPFHGGDKMLGTEKDWKDAIMSVIKEVKGSAFWYSPGSSSVGGVNLTDIFFDAVANVLTMRGKFIHSEIIPGNLTWSGDLHIDSIIGPLFYNIPANTITLNDKQVAYVSLVRNQNFQSTNTFTFTNGSTTITASSLVAGIFAGDWIKFFSDDMSKWAQIQSVVGNTITLIDPYEGTSGSGIALRAQGSYTMQVADPLNVPASSDTFWIAKRDDNGAITAVISASPVGAVRAGGQTTFQTTAPHGINAGENVEVSGVADISFNNIYEVLSVPSPTTFLVQNTGPDATSGSGTVNSTATLYLRGIGEVSQGESSADVSSALQALLQYTGAAYAGDIQPQYPSTNYVTQGIDLTTAIGELDAQAGSSTSISNQDRNLKLVRGGIWSVAESITSGSLANDVSGFIISSNNSITVGTKFLSQSFVPTSTGSASEILTAVYKSGSPTGNITMEIQADSAGNPSGVALATSNPVNVATLPTNYPTLSVTTFTFSSPPTLTMGTTYHFVLKGVAVVYGGGGFFAGISTTNTYASGLLKQSVDSGGTWTSPNAGNDDFYFDVQFSNPPSLILTWSQDASIQVPGLAEDRNNISAGSIALPNDGDVAYVEINRTAGAPANLTVSVSAIDTLVATTNTVIIARRFGSGSGILAQQLDDSSGTALDGGGPLTAVGNSFVVPGGGADISTVNMRMNKTGTPAGNITISVQADSAGSPSGIPLYSTVIPVSGIATAPTISDEIINVNVTLSAGTYHLVAESDATYKASFSIFGTFVSIKHKASGASAPYEEHYNGSVWTTSVGSALYYIISENGTVSSVVVGSHSFNLIADESKELDAGMSIENRTAIGLSDEAQSSPAWNTNHSSPLRTIASDTQDVFSAGASIDTEIDKFFGQLRIKAASPISSRVIITNPDVSMLTGEKRSQQISSLLLETDGAQINFQTGIIYKADGVTARGINFTPVIPAAGMFRWFSIGVIPSTANANNTLESQILIIPAASNGATAALAPKAPFSDGVLNLGQVVITSANGTTVTAIPQVNLIQLGVGSGSGSGSGSGVGDDLNALGFLASFTDDFSKLPDTNSPVDISAGKTDSNTYSVVNQYYRIAYDASKTVTGTGTSMTLSGTPSFTVKIGDILRVGTEARRITVVTSQVLYTIESAFSTDPSAAAATVSQAVYTKDLNNYNFLGLAISDAFSGSIAQLLMYYQDSETIDDKTQDNGVPPNVAYIASSDGTSYSHVNVRPEDLFDSQDVTNLPSDGTNLFVRFFSNKSSGSGFVNILGYKVFTHREAAEEAGDIPKMAFTRTAIPVVGTQINCSTSVVGGKTRIRLNDFTYPVGLSVPALRVLLNGQDIDRFIDGPTSTDAYYLEIDEQTIDLDTNYSSINDSLKIIFDVPVVDSSETNSSNLAAINEIFQDEFQSVIDEDAVLTAVNGTPNAIQFRSDIVGRASIPDLTQDLLPRMGLNRVMVENIIPLPDEQGPSGQAVFGALNDKFNQIRYVGSWRNTGSILDGVYAITGIINDYVEVVWYGTGLNMLLKQQGNIDLRVSIDGGAEGGDLFPTNPTPVIDQRHYATNGVVNITFGLALGIHTAKIRMNNSVDTIFYGFEFLTESTTIKIPPGSAFVNGKKFTHALLESISYNSSFESGTLGTKGGRVRIYLKPDGSIAKSVTPTDASSFTLTSANHTNEEIIKTSSFREYGAARTDDFSTLTTSASDRVFTLDDDTTTLAANDVIFGTATNQPEALRLNVNGAYTIITFVGTGLDIIQSDDNDGGADSYNISIDGGSTIALPTAGVTAARQVKLVSGLSYGTHTVKITRVTASTWQLGIVAYKIYGPKKPTLPIGAVELADYNVMGNYVATTSASVWNVSEGILRKQNIREMIYFGTWSSPTQDVANFDSGWNISTNTSGSYIEYVFFGTGVEWNMAVTTGAYNTTVTIDGSSNLSGFVTTLVQPGTGLTFTAATGAFAGTSSTAGKARIQISSLSSGFHTFRFTTNNGEFNYLDSLDIITPIHSQKFNENMVIQNTLMVGSQGLSDNRKQSIHSDLPQSKHVAQATGIVVNLASSISTFVPLADLSLAVVSNGAMYEISSNCTFQTNNGGGTGQTKIYVDGRPVGSAMEGQSYTASGEFEVGNRTFIYLPRGVHQVDLHWTFGGGASTITGVSTYRVLTAREI